MVNYQNSAAVNFIFLLYGFLLGRGAGTSSRESKLLQKLMEIMEEVLYKLFLNLRKAYNALNKKRCLVILLGYGIGLKKERVI